MGVGLRVDFVLVQLGFLLCAAFIGPFVEQFLCVYDFVLLITQLHLLSVELAWLTTLRLAVLGLSPLLLSAGLWQLLQLLVLEYLLLLP